MSAGSDRQNQDEPESRLPVTPQRPGLGRVWVSLALFTCLVATFAGLIGRARWQSAVRVGGDETERQAAEVQVTGRLIPEDIRVPLEGRRVMLVVREMIDGKTGSGETLTGLVTRSLKSAGFECVESPGDIDVRVDAARAGAASYLICSARTSSRPENNGTGGYGTYVSTTIDMRLYRTDPSQVLYARKAADHVVGTSLENALQINYDTIATPLSEEVRDELVGLTSHTETGTETSDEEPGFEPAL